MRVLLISPPITTGLYKHYERPTIYTPLGLAYLAATLRENGHEPTILDCLAEGWRTQQARGDTIRYGLSEEEITARIHEVDPHVVGITCMFSEFDRDRREIVAVVKKAKPEVPVIFGGAVASAEASTLVQEPGVDLVVRGEGEQTLVRLLERLEADGVLPGDLPGTTTRERENPPVDLLPDLDKLPLPARDLLPMELYQENQRAIMPYAMNTPIGFIMSSRGCPFRCIFCSTRCMWPRWRPRSPKNVVDEIEVLVKEYGVREIAFLDDSFIVDPERVREMCAEIRARKLKISWSVPVGLTVWRVTEDILRAMRDSGFYRACFPIESGDPEMLEYIRKPVDLDQVLRTIRSCHKLGIWAYGNFIIGFPEQTGESIEKTIQFAEDCGLDMISAYIAQPYKGAELWDIMRDMGLMDGRSQQDSNIFQTRYDTKYFTAEELTQKRAELNTRFTKKRIRRLFTPQGMLDAFRKVNSPKRFLYALRILRVFLGASFVSKRFNIIPE